MSEQIDIDINVNMNNADDVDELTSKLEAANAEVERLTDELAQVEMGEVDGDAEALGEELANATAEAEALQSELDNLHVDNKDIDETNEKLEEAESSASSLGTALGGLAGMMGVDQMIETADKINTSWNQLELTFGTVSAGMKSSIDSATSATGRSGGEIRGYFNSMGIAGIKNTELLSSSFQSLSGKSYQTGKDIGAMQNAVQKMVMSGNAGQMSLQRLGLTAEDLGAAMGVTGDEAKKAFAELDQEGRLEAITKAMGDGEDANNMYKNSYVGLKQQAETAMAGLAGAIGQGTLPVIVPIIKGATGVVKGFTDGFKNLPGPIQGAVGGIAGFLAVGATVVGTLGLVGQVGSGVVSGLKSMKSGYDGVRSAMGTAKLMMDALRNSESITEGVRAALAIATGAETAAEGGSAAAKTAAIGPTTGLAIAENSLLWPLLLIVGAIIAVVAVMWYLYNTNETVRNGINWLIAQFQAFIASLQPIVNGIIRFVTQGIANMGKLPGAIWNIFLRVLTFVTSWQTQLISYGVRAAHGFVNNVKSAIGGVVGAIQSALSGVASAITKPFRDAWNFVKPYVDRIKEGLDVLNPFNGFLGYSSFEGYAGLDDTLNGTLSTISTTTNPVGMTVNNNFNGIVEESVADYIINTVNDKLRREKLLKGAD